MVVDAPSAPARRATSTWPVTVAGVAAWSALVAVALVWGTRLVDQRPEMKINAAPFVGRWELHVGDGAALAAALVVAATAVAGAPVLARRLPWRALLGAVAALAVVWLLALNAVDGPGALRDPLTNRNDYVVGVPDVEDAGGAGPYLESFTERIADYPTHVSGHPPGLVVALWSGDQVGLDPVPTSLALVLAGWGTAIAATLIALREVAGEGAARRVAPILALVPGAVWAGTSLDAFFAGVAAVAVAALVLATGTRGRRSDLLALAGGAVVGVGLLLSYGMAPILAIPILVSLLRRRLRPLVLGAVVAAGVLGTMVVLGGFWWREGLDATRVQYELGLARFRPYRYWTVGNLAAVAVASGPFLGAGLAHLVRTVAGSVRAGPGHLARLEPAALAVGAVGAVLAADLSGLSKGEAERIWLLFVPWLATAGAFLPHRAGQVHRGWLAGQVAVALVVQVALRSPW